jgi:hypothetical protein
MYSIISPKPPFKSDRFSQYRIIGLTWDTSGAKVQELADLPQVEMIAKDWTMINSDWLKDHKIERLYIALHNGVLHFCQDGHIQRRYSTDISPLSPIPLNRVRPIRLDTVDSRATETLVSVAILVTSVP